MEYHNWKMGIFISTSELPASYFTFGESPLSIHNALSQIRQTIEHAKQGELRAGSASLFSTHISDIVRHVRIVRLRRRQLHAAEAFNWLISWICFSPFA